MLDRNHLELQYKVFDFLRFPLIVGVVFIHCFGNSFDYESIDFANLTGIDVFNLFRVSISRVLTHICVPTFFFISGFLFFKGMEEWNIHIYIHKLKKRIKTLLVPYLIWNTIKILLVLKGIFKKEGISGVLDFLQEKDFLHLYWDCNQWNLDRLDWLGVADLSSAPYLVPLWFLRDLMVVMILSPFIFLLFKKMKKWGVLLLGLLYVSRVFFHLPGLSITAFFFFGVGMYCKINDINVAESFYKYRKILCATMFALWIFCTLFNGHHTRQGSFIYPFFVIVGVISLMNFTYWLVSNNKIVIPSFFSKSSFFVYLSHMVLIKEIASKIANNIFGGDDLINQYLNYLLVPSLTIVLCCSLYYFLNRFFPYACKILTGSRV